ncbi:PBSX family phage terminase large subunit [Streptomyces sp. NPDC005576]|uniref:PBSX family phage terminase large subunit n=1 Tax=Streptomyces sp. NPDC005576 TaxID=3364726 RepID=UPI00368C6FE3
MIDGRDLGLSRRQLEFIGQSDAPINIATGAIRSGKTVASLLRWLIYVASAPRGGELIMCGKTSTTIHRNVFLPMQDPDLFGDLAKQVHYTAGAPMATILGRRVHVLGANDAKSESKLRGFTCAGAYGDEISLMPQGFWEQLTGRMSVADSKIFGTSNPDNPGHWLMRDWLSRPKEAAVKHWHFTLDDNDALTEKFKNNLRSMHQGIFYRRFILGEWVAAEGAIFDMWDDERHIVDEMPRDGIHRWIALGVDYGTRNPLHAVLIGLGRDRRLYVAREWRYDGRARKRQLTDAEYSERIRGWLADVPGIGPVRPQFVTVDPSAASFNAQLRRDKLTPTAANNAVLDGIRVVSSLFAQGNLLVHSSCKELIAEIPSYSWDDKAALKGEDKPVKVADHGVDALRYGIFTTRALWQNKLAQVA